ncbi:MAG: hypothetical protein AB1461_10285 [Thermodesulfobacteriota bacterium]
MFVRPRHSLLIYLESGEKTRANHHFYQIKQQSGNYRDNSGPATRSRRPGGMDFSLFSLEYGILPEFPDLWQLSRPDNYAFSGGKPEETLP